MSQRILLGCDFNGCKVRLEVTVEPTEIMRTQSAVGWMCLREPSMMNRSIDLCPEHAKLFDPRQVT